MVEMRYDENSGHLKLPKNIRQIGKTQGQTKIYVEDYVITFINQLAQISPMEPKLAILLGYTVKKNDKDYVFIHGAIEASGVNIQEDHIGFTSGIWSRIYEDIKTYFGDAKVAGWFLTRPGKALKVTEKIRKIHVDNFPGENKALFVIDPLDSEEFFYIYKQGELVRQEGYYIYYERNEEMQNYMIEHKDQQEAEDVMNQVLIEEENEEERSQNVIPFMKSTRGKRLAQKIKKEKSGKSDYNKVIAGLTRMASLFLILVVAVAGVITVRRRNDEQWMSSLTAAEDNAQEGIDLDNISGDLDTASDNALNNGAGNGEDNAAGNAANNTAGNASDNINGYNSDGTGSLVQNGSDTQGISDSAQGTAQNSDDNSADIAVSANAGKTYLIQEGDTLASISRQFYNDYQHVEDICQLNNIEDADTIFPGMTIVLP